MPVSTVIPYRQIHQEVSEAEREELQVLRNMNITQNFVIRGEDDEECERLWLDQIDADSEWDKAFGPEAVLYVSEPGTDRENLEHRK